jgi:hypothetical protein
MWYPPLTEGERRMHILNDAGSIDIQSERDMMAAQSFNEHGSTEDHVIRNIVQRMVWAIALIVITGLLCFAVEWLLTGVRTTHDVVAALPRG